MADLFPIQILLYCVSIPLYKFSKIKNTKQRYKRHFSVKNQIHLNKLYIFTPETFVPSHSGGMGDKIEMKKPEILAPSGNFEKMKFAILYGADAVYLAGEQFGMRTASDNFTRDELREAVEYAHKRNVKVYVTVNILPHPAQQKLLPEYLEYLESIKPDALIISDLGVFSMAKKYAPSIELHVSTQASTVNAEACKMWHSLGASRVVLARELSLSEISDIRSSIPEKLELEAFVHGAMCVSYSGRCLLSNFFTCRDANRGNCAQPCRWEYNVHEIKAQLSEVKRPEDVIEVIQDKHGTYLFSSKDMCMIEHIPELVRAGIDSFKIEGRVKSAYYTAVTANAYKSEVNAFFENPDSYKMNPYSLEILESVSHRRYGTGYYFDTPGENAQIAEEGGYIREKAFLATVESYDAESGRCTLLQRNKTYEGERVRLISPFKEAREIVLEDMRDEKGVSIPSSPHPKMLYSVKAPFEVKAGDIICGI